MSRLDAFRKTTEAEKEKEKKHTTPAREGHSVADILHGDTKTSHAFFEFLNKSGNADLAKRVHKGELDAGDAKVLDKKREVFSEKLDQIEKLESFLTEENINSIARNNPDLAKIVRVHGSEGGSEKVVRAVQSQLLEMAVMDESRFKRMVSAVGKLESYQNTYKAVDEEVERMCKERNISPDEYYAALAIKDTGEKDKALKELAGKTYGGFKKSMNWLSGGKFFSKDKGNLDELKRNEAVVKYSLEQFAIHQKNIGSALFASLDKNKAMRDALSRELIGKDAEQEPSVGFEESRIPAVDDKKLKEDWEAEKKKPSYRNLRGGNDRKGARAQFLHEQKKKVAAEVAKRGSSFLIDLLASLTESFINDKEEELPL